MVYSLGDSIWRATTQQLEKFVAIPSIGNTKNRCFNINALFKAAVFAGGALTDMGFTVDYIKIEGAPPFVIAEKIEKQEFPTILFYSHYDIDVSELRGFSSNPKDQHLYGTGVNEGKGEIVALLTVLRMCPGGKPTLPVNVKILLEGERHSGSPHLEALLKAHAEKLNATALVTFKGMNLNTNIGQMQYYCPTEKDTNIPAHGSVPTIDRFKTILSARDVGPLPVAYLQALQENFSAVLAEECQEPPLPLRPFIAFMPKMPMIIPAFKGSQESQPIDFYQRTIRSLSSFLDKAKGTSQASTK
jgi:hypothetical protein